jgi:hypothetical protein
MHGLDTPLLTPAISNGPARHGNTTFQCCISDKALRPQLREEFLSRYHLVRMG